MRKSTIALTAAALAFAGLGLAVSAQQKPAATKAGANTVVVYKSPT
jgi:phosphate-selective porin